MDHSSTFEKVLRSVLTHLVLIFFLFSDLLDISHVLQTNETILRIPLNYLRTEFRQLPCPDHR